MDAGDCGAVAAPHHQRARANPQRGRVRGGCAAGMKIFLIYDAAEVPPALHNKFALTLPSKWLGQSVDKLLEAFVGNYNKKFAASPLDDEDMVLQVKDESPFTLSDTKTLRTSDTPEAVLTDKMEVRIVRRPAPKKDADGCGRSRCKNYGCQCEFDEASNHDAACRHHARAPVFHDTRKWWSCCEGIKVYSFDEMMAIPGHRPLMTSLPSVDCH